jgi:hypothetical protein
MRESLKQSVADSPAKEFERYRKGSVVLCNCCAKPIAKLDRGIDLGAKAGQAASAFKPLTLQDLADLGDRRDVDAGVRAAVAAMTPDERRAHVAKLREFKAGDPMACPLCGEAFVQVLAVERTAVLDRAYTIELLTIPPQGAGEPAPVRGRQLGTGKDWLHESAKVVH